MKKYLFILFSLFLLLLTGCAGSSTQAPLPSYSPPPSPTAVLDLPLPDIDIDSWEFTLVNTNNPLDKSFAPPELVYLSDSKCPIDSRVSGSLTAFANAASSQGYPVYLSSGYISYQDQAIALQRKLDQGYTYEDAIILVSAPGTSEHQTGLCCDITDTYRATKSTELEQTDTYKWMRDNCQTYGFIVRYPSDKHKITNVPYEPWHFRYVGVEAATYIMTNGLSLEEFIALYK